VWGCNRRQYKGEERQSPLIGQETPRKLPEIWPKFLQVLAYPPKGL
jgi:hypothetical protein